MSIFYMILSPLSQNKTEPVISCEEGDKRKLAIVPTFVGDVEPCKGAISCEYSITLFKNDPSSTSIANPAREANGPGEIALTR
jgi:hypothetical protein